MNRFFLTVFTPTYNRAHTLGSLYDSLCSQTMPDFEWIVVDDGSTDNTRELVEGWIAEKKISIRYFYQENSGKMAAHNFAVDAADSDLFLCLDSDDRLFETAVYRCSNFWKSKVNEAGMEEICGFVTYKEFSNNVCIEPGMRFLDKVRSSFENKAVHLADLRQAGCFGETSIIARTDILRKHKYPVFKGEKFVTDAYLWEQLDSQYLFYVLPYFSQLCTYNTDGYSFDYRRLLFSNPQGYRAYHNQRVRLGLSGKLKSAICYDSISARIGFKGFLSNAASPLLYFLMLPGGICKYLIDSIKLKSFGKLC